MMNLNQDRMNQVIQDAFNQTTCLRWQTAIVRAQQEFDSNPYMYWNPRTRTLMVLSPSNQIYVANSECQCKAFEFGKPCWHRAGARLLERYDDAR